MFCTAEPAAYSARNSVQNRLQTLGLVQVHVEQWTIVAREITTSAHPDLERAHHGSLFKEGEAAKGIGEHS
jgi:hypothetical protein